MKRIKQLLSAIDCGFLALALLVCGATAGLGYNLGRHHAPKPPPAEAEHGHVHRWGKWGEPEWHYSDPLVPTGKYAVQLRRCEECGAAELRRVTMDGKQ